MGGVLWAELCPQERRPQPCLDKKALEIPAGAPSWHAWPVAIGLGTSPTVMSGIVWSSAPLSLLSHFTDEEPAAQSRRTICLRSEDSAPGLWVSRI